MDEVREILKVSRALTAGVVLPPPVTVEEVYRWSLAQIAAYQTENNLYNINLSKEFMARAIEQARESREKIEKLTAEGLPPDRMTLEVEYAEEREHRAEQFREEIEKREALLEDQMKVVKSFPRVKVKKWNRVKRKFKINMQGWRYRSKVMQAPDKRRDYANNLFGTITVELVNGDLKTKGKAYWSANTATLKIKTGGDLHYIIEHELRHWVQSYMNVLIGKHHEFGRPSRKIKTPDISQWAKGPAARKLKQKGIMPDEFHSLDDVEFYTDLADEITEFEMKWKSSLIEFTKDEFFKVFVGMGDKEYSLLVSHFFKALKGHARGKWKKAVKELAKAVL